MEKLKVYSIGGHSILGKKKVTLFSVYKQQAALLRMTLLITSSRCFKMR
jgi:hypothetical protein